MSDLRDLCRKTYQEWVTAAPLPTEFKRALMIHERVPRFVDLLATELKMASPNIKRETVIKLIHSMCEYFVLAVDTAAQNRTMSSIQKMLIKKKQDEEQVIRNAVARLEALGETQTTTDNQGNETERQIVTLDENGLSGLTDQR